MNEVESIIRFPSPPGTSYFLMVTIITEKPEKMVSVPSGDFLFFNVMRECLVRFSHLFPSPPGTSYFLIICASFIIISRICVSVPSGDFLFFNRYRVNFMIVTEKFPSPPGTSYFLMCTNEKFLNRYLEFPSPPGTSYFLIGRK